MTGHRHGRDRGTIAMYTVLFTPIVLLLAGLLVDGGLAIHARQRAADVAEQAARAGANQIDTAALRGTGRPSSTRAGHGRRRATCSRPPASGSPRRSATPTSRRSPSPCGSACGRSSSGSSRASATSR
ncbi:TadE family protein [Actinomadura madurae]|uniref:TadE family protein n=1 Tax=Actinomadura madurae TaxID=1993 RepID=UPI0020D233EF|nr:TadE family protein [Actinomadura madurae]MCP9950632.1 pilus assembly protein [Actinomadura madurae]MCP9967410.1 pilus assembly protein [Actinomadura madurae]MCQ0008605.1 pilus assembly protein [Actinomadura madurae]